jgi:hypothetical protein
VDRQLAAQREELRRRGEPVDPSDLSIAPLPDNENAWVLQMQAAALENRSSPSGSALEYANYPPFGAAWDQLASGSEQANGAAFQLARQARDRPRAQLRSSYTSPLFNISFAGLNPARSLANTLGDSAMYRHLSGDDVGAIERLLDTLHIARSLHQDDALVSQLVGIGITALAYSKAQIIAPRLRVDSPQTRRAVEVLIAAMLDDRDAEMGVRRSFLIERLAVADLQKWQSDGTWVLRPLARQQILWTNNAAAVWDAAAQEPDLVAARRVLSRIGRKDERRYSLPGLFTGSPRQPDVPRYSRWYGSQEWSFDRYLQQWFRARGDRRATAVSLAAQLYRADHGRWPERLEQLAPAYLPAVPADPFHDAGRPLGYVVLKNGLPDGGDRPLVYFDAGDVAQGAIDSEPMFGWQTDPMQRSPRVEVRQYRDIARWSPTTRRFDKEQKEREEWVRAAREDEEKRQQQRKPTTSPEAVENNPSQPDAPRDDAQKNDKPQN